MCQTANHWSTTHPRRRKSEEDLSFLENMHKVLRTLSVVGALPRQHWFLEYSAFSIQNYNRPQNQYRVERIVTVPSLVDVAESEDKFLKVFIEIFA